MTDPMLATMEECFEGRPEAEGGQFAMRTSRTIDVAAKMREMW